MVGWWGGGVVGWWGGGVVTRWMWCVVTTTTHQGLLAGMGGRIDGDAAYRATLSLSTQPRAPLPPASPPTSQARVRPPALINCSLVRQPPSSSYPCRGLPHLLFPLDLARLHRRRLQRCDITREELLTLCRSRRLLVRLQSPMLKDKHGTVRSILARRTSAPRKTPGPTANLNDRGAAV